MQIFAEKKYNLYQKFTNYDVFPTENDTGIPPGNKDPTGILGFRIQ
jgi:hypothetical protein